MHTVNQRSIIALIAFLAGFALFPARANADDVRGTIVSRALSHVGSRYKTGGTAPPAFDCSGFVGYVLKPFVAGLPRLSRDMAAFGRPVDRDALAAGDLVFFATTGDAGAISHVALFIGDGKIVHAISDGPERGVTVTPLDARYWKTRYRWARRVLAGEPAVAKPVADKPAVAKHEATKPADAKPTDEKPADAKPASAKPAETASPWDTWDGIVRGDYEQWKEQQKKDFEAHKNAFDATGESDAFEEWKKEHER